MSTDQPVAVTTKTAEELAAEQAALRLATLRQEFVVIRDDATEHLVRLQGNPSHDNGDEVDTSMTREEFENILAQRECHQHALDAAIAAIARIDAGSYGICSNCHQGISEERLEAMPTAEYCIACQRLYASQGYLRPPTA